MAVAVFFLFFVVRYVNTTDEAVFFHLVFIRAAVAATLSGLVIAAIFAPALTRLLSKWKKSEGLKVYAIPQWKFAGWFWRLIAGDVLNVLFYFAAGSIARRGFRRMP